MKITLRGIDHTLAYNLRARILFENIADRSFSLATTTDWVMFVYSMLLSGSKDAEITLDEFIDEIETVQLNNAISWATEQMKVEDQLLKKDVDSKKKP